MVGPHKSLLVGSALCLVPYIVALTSPTREECCINYMVAALAVRTAIRQAASTTVWLLFPDDFISADFSLAYEVS